MTDFNIESLPVTIKYVAEVPAPWGNNKSMADQWLISLQNKNGYWSTNYWTGSGLRKNGRPKCPKIADVLYTLFSDASAADYNFSDWCSEFGYSDDSISALNTYKQCLEIATALRKYFDAETRSKIQEIIQDM